MGATTSLFDVTGRVAVVTGGNGGIGRAIALGLARAGASVAVLARNEQKNQAVLAELQKLGVPSLALQLDVTDRAALATAMAQVEMQLGPIDILVNNAGIAKASGGVLAETAEAWDATLETHLNSCFLLSQLAARSMVGRKSGKIINLAKHVLILRRSAIAVLQRSRGRRRATEKVDGHRTRTPQHTGQCNCSRLDRDRNDGTSANLTNE